MMHSNENNTTVVQLLVQCSKKKLHRSILIFFYLVYRFLEFFRLLTSQNHFEREGFHGCCTLPNRMKDSWVSIRDDGTFQVGYNPLKNENSL